MTDIDNTASQLIAHFASSFDLKCVPETVVNAARLHLLDSIGVGLAASSLRTLPDMAQAVAVLGANEEATGLGLDYRLSATSAAMLNGSLIHAIEFDGTHMESVIHASAVIAPTALAVAEREGRSGAALLAAFVLGWEVFARFGLAAPTGFHERGFQGMAVGGAPVSALVAAQLLGLDPRITMHAMGVAGSQASGIFEFIEDGANVKMCHGGWPAHSGIVACALASVGVTGPSRVFEGDRGVFRAFTGDLDAGKRFVQGVRDLGERWLLPHAAIKPFACCHYLQSALEAAQELKQDGVRVESIRAIECSLAGEVAWLVCEPWPLKLEPPSGHVAKFSLPFCLAIALLEDEVSAASFDWLCLDDLANAHQIRALMSRIRFSPLANAEFPKRYASKLRIEMVNGEVREMLVRDVRGSAQRPLNEAEVIAKFRRNAAQTLTEASIDRVVHSVLNIESLPSASDLGDALRER